MQKSWSWLKQDSFCSPNQRLRRRHVHRSECVRVRTVDEGIAKPTLDTLPAGLWAVFHTSSHTTVLQSLQTSAGPAWRQLYQIPTGKREKEKREFELVSSPFWTRCVKLITRTYFVWTAPSNSSHHSHHSPTRRQSCVL